MNDSLILVLVRMNLDCIFNVLLYGDFKLVVSCLLVNKSISQLHTPYLYKLLCERVFSDDHIKFNGTFYEKYVLLNQLNKINIDKINLKILYDSTGFSLYNGNYEDKYNNILKDLSILPNLESITIKKCNIKSIPKKINELTKLIRLNIETSGLKFVPKEINALTNLAQLNLFNNNLVSIPDEIYTLIELKYLDLSCNNISHLSSKIGSLINLNGLIIHSNELTAIPKEISTLPNLFVLDLRDNKINYVPKEIKLMYGTRNLNKDILYKI